MGIPSRPMFLIEGPATACILSGQELGWKNCTCLSFAMGIDKSTLGHVRLSGCEVRHETGDTVGGTTIEECAAVAAAHGVHVEIHTGPGVASPPYAFSQAQGGRGFSLAGNTTPLGKGNVNHNVWVNEASGGTAGAPANLLVYDPWSSGPAWWSRAKVDAFAAALHPWGETDPRLLGPGKFYCGIFPDTEPHDHPAFGSSHTTPFPDNTTFKSPVAGQKANVRSAPHLTAPVVATPADGTPFQAFQVATGDLDRGSRVWYGNHDGNEWTHESNLTGKGGTS